MILPSVQDYTEKKFKWFKAVEILIEIVTRAAEDKENPCSVKERNTFRHQFILNYLNKPSRSEKVKYITETIFSL